jgi:hypothetical protein
MQTDKSAPRFGWRFVRLGLGFLTLVLLAIPDVRIHWDPGRSWQVSLTLLALWFLLIFSDKLAEISVFGFKARFQDLDSRLDLVAEALLGVLTQGERAQLDTLMLPNSPEVEWQGFLKEEMTRLCQHGFASERPEAKGKFWDFTNGAKYRLSEYFQITERGRKYLRMVQEIEKGPR